MNAASARTRLSPWITVSSAVFTFRDCETPVSAFRRAADDPRLEASAARDGQLGERTRHNVVIGNDQSRPIPDHPRARAAHRAAHQHAPDNHRPQDSVHDTHQPHVEASIAVQDVAELVRNDTLELVTPQQFKAASRDADGHVALRMAGGKGVDAALVDIPHGIDRDAALPQTGPFARVQLAETDHDHKRIQ